MTKEQIIKRLQQAINQVESMSIEGDTSLFASTDEGSYCDAPKHLEDFTLDFYQDEDEADKIFLEIYLENLNG